MLTKIYSFCLVFTALSIFATTSFAEVTSATIEREITKVGAKNYLKAHRFALHRDPWKTLLEKVSSGDLAWMKIAVVLYDQADAGLSDMLGVVLGDFITHNPRELLMATQKIHAKPTAIGAICRDFTLDTTPPYNPANDIATLTARAEAVKSVTDVSLAAASAKCISAIESTIKWLKKGNFDSPPEGAL